MPKFRYVGTGPCRYGGTPVNPGDVVDASDRPGKNFVEVVEQSEPRRKATTKPAPEAEEK